MLIAYLEPFILPQLELLDRWGSSVSYWPRSQIHRLDLELVTDWWLLFNNHVYADLWLLKYPEHSLVVRTLFD